MTESRRSRRHPAFNLEGNDGKKHSLEDYQGKTGGAIFLSEGRYAGLYEGSLRLSRPQGGFVKEKRMRLY